MKTQNPWMGRARGSAGNMTGCKVYDKNVLRAKAFEVSNPDTAAQQTQRAFFKEVAGIVATVSEEELRSLFGIKPKGMSRRNALSKQIAAAFSVDGNEKHVDFSKLQSIGNGSKVTTQIERVNDGLILHSKEITIQMLGSSATENTNLIAVFFNETDKSIVIINSDLCVEDVPTTLDVIENFVVEKNGYAYVTCASNGENVCSRNFGSFSIKTRATEKSAPTPPQPQTITVNATGFAAWDTFTLDLSGTNAAGGTPSKLVNDGNVVCSGFSEAGTDVFTGSFVEAVDASAETTLEVTMPNSSKVTLNVQFAD